jgi:hypothetical protein
MGNKKCVMWYLILYLDKNKRKVLKIINCKTLKDIAYLLNMKYTEVANFYHGQKKAKGVLEFISITQNYNI